MITALHLVSDIGYSFLLGALVTILLGRGVPPAQAALISLIGTLYFARFLVGPIVDKAGRYRVWLVVTQVVLVVLFVGLSRLDPSADLTVVLLGTIAVVLVSMFHDTALGGLSVRLLEPADRGLANGLQVAGASVSILIGGGAAITVYAWYGWTPTLLCLAAVFAVPLSVLAVLREPHAEAPADPPASSFAGFFRQRRVRVWTLLVAPFLVSGAYLATAIQPAMLLAAGWRLEQVAAVQFGLGPIVGVAAGLLTGVAINFLGRRRSLVLIGLLETVAFTALVPLSLGGSTIDMTAVLAVALAYSAIGTWVATICMDLARSDAAATDLSLQTSCLGALRMITSFAGLTLIGLTGSAPVILTSVVLAAAGTVGALRWLQDGRDEVVTSRRRR